ncbi:SPL family radical SAM protein [Desulfurococcus mucosus]|uniref:Radical SAM domain protein n=1 Tax=Desulfurococcus mucosus (strain ATCC 35584 / DSM 2162 / JCM 9187 / O7/1) TaxID=765177 RepID=E8R9S8_DESM0|nr:Radical SAM domain protein [Desulfurococcus mucosus DSM 2162]
MHVLRVFDPWRSPLCTCPFKYSLHPYTGCSHFCLYCYATSYIGRRPSTPKPDFTRRLERDLDKARRGSVVELSSSSDPYPPLESWMGLTRRSLEILGKHGFKILVTTKSNIVERDVDLLARYPSSVMITITTLDQELSRKLEPGAPPPDKRLDAVRRLSDKGIPVGVRLDPIIPFLNDDPAGIRALIREIKEAGALQVTVSTYKAKWDSLRRLMSAFPEISVKLRELYVGKGEFIHGYMYLPRSYREALLKPAVEEALRSNLYVATCREGLSADFMKAPSCDGSGLIRMHPSIVDVERRGETSG